MTTRQSIRISTQKRTPPEPPSPTPIAKKKKKTVAESCREYKDRLKTDPEKYAAYKEQARQYSHAYRATSSQQQKDKEREQARLRMRAMRERKKEQTAPATRASEEEKRAKWREEKRKQADKITPQKRRRLNEKRRQLYQEKKMAALAGERQISTTAFRVTPSKEPAASDQDVRTPAARRKTLSRVKAAMPLSPRKYAQVLKDLRQKASPRKKALLQATHVSEESAHIGEEVKKQLFRLKKSRSKAANAARDILLSVCRGTHTSVRSMSRALGVHRKTVCLTKEEVKDEIKKEKKMEKEIKEFFDLSATTLPSKKHVSKKTGAPVSVLRQPLTDLHTVFQETYGVKVSLAHFAQCRPGHVRTSRTNFLRQCLCEYCENGNLKIAAVNRVAARHNNSCRIRHVYHAVDLVTCGRQDGKWAMQCAFRECAGCQDSTALQDHVRPLLLGQGHVTWMRWESRPAVFKGKSVSRKMLVKKDGTMEDLMSELKTELVFLASHLFRADWQYLQFNTMRHLSPFPQHTVVMVLDFAENFTCSFQDEVQAAHWHHEQVTVHPTVTYYACRSCQETVTESLVFVSDDRTHDFHAVHEFTTQAVQHLSRVRHIQVEHIVQWTDGCAAQYKSKGPFADISHALGDYNCTFERHFFGSRHGKGPSDGESAVVKSGAARAVKGGLAVISNAAELFSYCVSSPLNKQPEEGGGCMHALRTFFFVSAADIDRTRDRAVATVKGTRTLHAVRCEQSNVLLTRKLSCSCLACRSGVGACEQLETVGPWTKTALKSTRSVVVPQEGPADPSTPANHLDTPAGPATPSIPADLAIPSTCAEVDTPADLAIPSTCAEVDTPADLAIPSTSAEVDAPADPSTVPTPPTPTVSDGDFLVISVQGKQRTLEFFAKVLAVEDEELHVRYLVKKRGTDMYIWSDSAWVTMKEVVEKVPPPTLAPGRGVAFIF